MSFTIVTSSFTIDTNILIYAADRTSQPKQQIAGIILEKMIALRGVLPLQCLSEFYRATTRKKLMSPEDAQNIVQHALYSLEIVPSRPEDLVTAMRIHQKHSLQFFDALLISTARRSGCHTLLTEDMQQNQLVDG